MISTSCSTARKKTEIFEISLEHLSKKFSGIIVEDVQYIEMKFMMIIAPKNLLNLLC